MEVVNDVPPPETFGGVVRFGGGEFPVADGGEELEAGGGGGMLQEEGGPVVVGRGVEGGVVGALRAPVL